MNMSFILEISVNFIIILLMLYFCYGVIQKNKIVQSYFIKHQKYLSPNCISKWRKYFGAPTIAFFVYGMVIEDKYIVYASVWFYVFLAISDLLDGVVARSCNLKTEEGAKLDAECDKWFDLPALFVFSLFPVFEPIYLINVSLITTFDIIGQYIRGKNSPPEAGIVGKIKTTIKFSNIYLMSFIGRYPEIYVNLKLEIVILVLLILASVLAGLSMGMKTK